MHPHDLTGSETWNIVEPCWLTDRREPSARQGFENWILKTKPRLGRSPGEGKSYPLQYSGLENSMECIVHGVTKSQTRLSYFHSLSLSSLQSSTTLTFLHEFFQSLLVMFKDPIPKSSGNLRRPWDLKWWKTWDFCPSSFSYFEVCASSLHQDVFHMVQA